MSTVQIFADSKLRRVEDILKTWSLRETWGRDTPKIEAWGPPCSSRLTLHIFQNCPGLWGSFNWAELFSLSEFLGMVFSCACVNHTFAEFGFFFRMFLMNVTWLYKQIYSTHEYLIKYVWICNIYIYMRRWIWSNHSKAAKPKIAAKNLLYI